MPSGVHTIGLAVPIHTIWSFVSDMNKWAPLVPGYIEHEIINERQSTWVFKGDLGFVKKTVKLRIDIKEWIEPSKVTFDLTGLSENFAGYGYFEAAEVDANNTNMTGCLDITAKGAMGPMINTILKGFVPKTAQELSEAIATRIRELENVSTS